jgi:NADH-quinone oxidoreductase subunit N
MVIDLATPAGISLALLPELFLTVSALVLMLAVGWRHKGADEQRLIGHLTLTGLGGTLLLVLWLWVQGARPEGVAHMIALDGFRFATAVIFLGGAIFVVMLSLGYLGRERILAPEYYVLLVLATIGMMLMGGASDLIVLFLGLELMSVCVYVLAGIDRRSVFGAEAALKYFLLGAFASGFLLYGIALLYGATGTTNLTLIDFQTTSLELGSNVMFLAGIAMFLVGFGFKVAAVPFHMWTPDVYDGAPTPITALMASAVKAAAFAGLVRVLVHALGDAVAAWQDVVWWLAAITMVAGNLMALAQHQIKRMLAYSSIGHAGYLLAALVGGTETGAGAFLFYALVYTLMTVGAFAVVAAVGRDGERGLRIDDFAGLGRARPWLAFAMAVFMLSLLGFPGTAGFIGKWYVLSAAIEADQWTLGIVLVGASVVSAGYYLPVIMEMYMKSPRTETVHQDAAVVGAARWVVGVAASLLLLFGFWPNAPLNLARSSSSDLKPPVEFTMDRTLPGR